MPTGYTAPVADGTVTDFPTFAMQCARAFGACIEMRDDPADTPIPDEFKPSEYHAKELAKATAERDAMLACGDDEWAVMAKDYNDRTAAAREAAVVKNAETLARYEAMLAQVKDWSPPSADHDALRDFMAKQLLDSIAHDRINHEIYQPVSVDDFRRGTIERLTWEVNYHAKQHAAEVERAAGRTLWVRQLRESLNVVPA